jgi:hypothetical protein
MFQANTEAFYPETAVFRPDTRVRVSLFGKKAVEDSSILRFSSQLSEFLA